jgi:hypothetical protein
LQPEVINARPFQTVQQLYSVLYILLQKTVGCSGLQLWRLYLIAEDGENVGNLVGLASRHRTWLSHLEVQRLNLGD